MSCIFNYYIFSPGPLWISASLLNGLPWLNKVYLYLYLAAARSKATGWLTGRLLDVHDNDLRWNSNPDVCGLANVTCKARDNGQEAKIQNIMSLSRWGDCWQTKTVPQKIRDQAKKITRTLTIFAEHGLMAHNTWWLSQWKPLSCIIQWSSFQ